MSGRAESGGNLNGDQGNPPKKHRTEESRGAELSDEELLSCITDKIPLDIPEDATLSPSSELLLNSFFDDMNIQRRLEMETDYMRLVRCQSEFKKFMNIIDGGSPSIHESGRYSSVGTEEDQLVKIQRFSSKIESIVDVAPSLATWLKECIACIPQPNSSTATIDVPSGDRLTEVMWELNELLSDLNSKKIPVNVVSNLNNIGSLCLANRIQEAEEEYLKIAIGKQQWLLGVGNCFIQERSALDRIRTAKHLLNDARVRAYVQAIKRLITIWDRILRSMNELKE
jgi:hypothetical protein